MRICGIAAVLGALLAGGAVGQTWDFEGPVNGWQEPAEAGSVVPEPERPGNHVYRITATQPHHTRFVLTDSAVAPDFIASLRFRLLSVDGAAPAVYVYGRLAQDFRALVVQHSGARTFCYFGQDRPSVTLGSTDDETVLAPGRWIRARFACFGDRVFAKTWAEGTREPRWQTVGQCPGQERGQFALGVWTSPRTPSTATVLFDDVAFRALTAADDLAGLGLRVTPRPPPDLGALPAGTAVAELADDVGIATPGTVLLCDRRTGDVTHLIDRASRQEFIAAAASQPLFRVVLTQPSAGRQRSLTADDFADVAVARTGPDALAWHFAKPDDLALGVTVTMRADKAGMVRLGATVSNDSEWAVSGLDLPVMVHPARLGTDAGDDHLVLPWADGSVLPAPGAHSQTRNAVYPREAFTQFTAFYDPTAGMYLAAYDTEGHCKRWTLRTQADTSVEMGLRHLRPEVPAQRFELPYEVAIGTFRGDWRDAAERYRAWAAKQWWCARPLTARDDIPAFLKHGSGILIASVNSAAAREKLFGAGLERLPEVLTAYRQRTGLAHLVFVPYGWENRGTWAGINYLPAVPSDQAWTRAAARLHEQGDRLAFLTSGFWWVVKRQASGNGPAFDDTAQFERLREMVIQQPDGTPFLVDNYATVGQFGDWRGLSAALCHGSPDACRTLRGAFLGVARLGVPLISFDQEIGGGQAAPCYSTTHGHPPGYGNWMWTGFRDLCAEILRQGKPMQPELGLFMENVSELAIPWMSTYWSRQFGEVDHGAVGARGVGLFSYLYHDYVTAIGAACVQGQGLHGTRPHPGLRRYVLANNLVRGLIPGPFLSDVPLEPQGGWQSEIAPAYFAYCQPYARFADYLLLGRSSRPPALQCADVELWYYRQDATGEPLRPGGPKVRKVPIALPAVVAGRFEAPDGSFGTVLANSTTDPQEVTLMFAPDPRPLQVLNSAGSELARVVPGPGPARVQLTLEPLGTRVIVQR